MGNRLHGIRDAVLIALAWGMAWAPIGVLVGLVVDPDDSMEEMWVAIGAYPGFLSGVIFAALVGIASDRRRLGEWSRSAIAGRGALAGLMVGVFPFTIGSSTSALPVWLLASIVIASITSLSVVSALATATWYSRRKEAPTRLASGGR